VGSSYTVSSAVSLSRSSVAACAAGRSGLAEIAGARAGAIDTTHHANAIAGTSMTTSSFTARGADAARGGVLYS
jgi:hypothetical protein